MNRYYPKTDNDLKRTITTITEQSTVTNIEQDIEAERGEIKLLERAIIGRPSGIE